MNMDEFSVSNKAKESETHDNDSDGVKGQCVNKLQSTESFPCRTMNRMMLVHDDHNQHRPSPSYDIGWVDGDGGGPTCNSKPKISTSDVYKAIGGVSGAAAVVSSGGLRTLQPFDIGVPADSATRTTQTFFKSPGVMAASMGFPFTNAQWKELERQAMIYKYMMASVPVPPDLLFPIIRNTSAASLGRGLNLLRFSSGGDLEPGRCRRTDGKKWRCSRDVAPNQKYCERHLHRGRPRSRKPVELPPTNKKKTRLEPIHPLPPPPLVPNSNVSSSSPHFVGTMSQPFSEAVESLKEQRCLDWMMKGESVEMSSSSGQEWHHLMQQTGIGLTTESSFSNSNNASVLNLNYGEQPLNLNSYANFSSSEEQQSNECPFFINPDLVSLGKQNHSETPRGFIDAWSNGVSDDDHNAHTVTKSSVSSNGNLSLSPLSLSMGGNNPIDDGMGQVEMGLGVIESGLECSTKPLLSSWLNPVSWAPSTPGGPLAEVLRPSTVTASDATSPTAGNVESGSCSTRVSSPSGVLQKTVASLSDSSGNSSPTLASSRANKPEIALLWLNQGKLASST